ncbi:MAG: nucleotide exchange factor GrpE, partial [Thaumarchaeota archaeon]|nr:nucleotide exchange factor GrpE [Nitrososphaerota archaeon]
IMEIISIMEDLDRALNIVGSTENTGLTNGLLLVKSRIDGILKSEDIKRIDAELGATFDPRIHEAVAFQDSETMEQGKIISVVGHGYTLGGKVIKPAMVEVARERKSKNSKKGSGETSGIPREVVESGERATEEESPQL